MMKQTIFSFVLCATFLISSQVFAQARTLLDERAPEWSLTEQNNRTKVYTRSYKNSNFKAFKAVSVLNQPISSILAILSDPVACPLWVEDCLSSGTLEVKNFNDRNGFVHMHLPWPFKDRTLAVHILTTNPNGKDEIQIATFSDNSLAYKVKNTVHINNSSSMYILRAINKTQTELTWMQHSNPEGNLPAWIVNAMIISVPLKSLAALEKAANVEKYQNKRIKYDELGRVSGLAIKDQRASD